MQNLLSDLETESVTEALHIAFAKTILELLSHHSCLEFLLPPPPLPPALLMSVAGEGMACDALCHAAHAALPSWSPSFLISLLCSP